jgi:hypothetical protein
VITAHAADLKHGADMPERDGHRLAGECLHALVDGLEKSALGATCSQRKRRAELCGARGVAVMTSIH